MAKKPLTVDTITHDATRKNLPTAELETLVPDDIRRPIQIAYERRNPDLDPQLVWRGKDMADSADLVVSAPPLYIQEKIHPKAIIADLKRQSGQRAKAGAKADAEAPDLFADFNGIEPEARTEFYAHDQHWSNRMILGDGLQVMASLAERDGLRGKVQCIYIDPPYGIKFNSNFQWSTTSRDVKDGKADHLTREPEQVKAFRDTWRDGIHSYLTYLRDRLTVARDLLTESGSIFVQIGDENVHRVQALMDEVFGDDNQIALITIAKTTSSTNDYISGVADYLIWYGKNKSATKYREPYKIKAAGGDGAAHYNGIWSQDGQRRPASSEEKSGLVRLDQSDFLFTADQLQSASMGRDKGEGAASWFRVEAEGRTFTPTMQSRWKTSQSGMQRLKRADRLIPQKNALRYMRRIDDFAAYALNNIWTDFGGATDRRYVVETNPRIVERCLLMATDPGDLVLDPTCGSGTTAYVAEQWGRRWITIDTSRVALALARTRLMSATYPWYLLADSRDGQMKEAEITRSPPKDTPTHRRVRLGFVYKRVPHITLKSIANNAEIDTIWESFQPRLEAQREALNAALGTAWQEWEIPRALDPGTVEATKAGWGPRLLAMAAEAQSMVNADHAAWWALRIERQQEIDASIAAKADTEYLYDQPYEDKAKVRVAGPFTVESLSPHRVPALDIDDRLFDPAETGGAEADTPAERSDFTDLILENIRKAGVQQAHREDRIKVEWLKGWPGRWVCAEAQVVQGDGAPERAGILVGPEYGTLGREDLMAAARECADAGFGLLIAAAFNYDAHASEVEKMGKVTILKARINPDLHMPDLANTGAGNLFTIFGEPEIKVHDEGKDGDGMPLVSIEIFGVDMYKAGQIESADADDIAVWFLDTDYDYESFFVRHAYFPGAANDPYKALKTTLKAEIDEAAWESLRKTRSRPFRKPTRGPVAVKVINHLGDEVMKVVGV